MFRKRMQALLLPAALFAPLSLSAQTQATVYATGLSNPSKIILGPSGTLLTSETSTDPNTGRISVISASAARRTLIDGLPSGLSAPNLESDGPNGLLLDGNTLYVAIGEGDILRNGTAQGTAIVNPQGFSSPALDCLLQLTFSRPVDQVLTSFTLKPADHSTLADGNPVTLTNSSGDSLTVSMLSSFRFRPDPTAIYRNSHPYALTKISSDPAHLYLTDAGLNSLVQVDVQTGRARAIVHFPPVPNIGQSGPPVAEAVPDSIIPYGDQLLVTLLSGFPFTPGDSKVVLVDPATQAVTPFINWLSSTIDITYRPRNNARPQFFVLQYSTDLLSNAPGRVLVYNTPDGTVLADGLKGPTSMALDAAAGKLYVTSRTDGTVTMIDVGQ